MNYLVVGDLHLKITNLQIAKKLFDWLNEFVNTKKEKELALVFLGDMYDTKSIIRVEVQNFFYQQLVKISKKVTSILMLIGNHDYTNKNLVDHAFNFGPENIIPNLTIVDKPIVFNSEVCAVPYYETEQDFFEAIKGFSSYKYLFCHQAFNGFFFNTHQSAEKHGADHTKIPIPSGAKIIAGHFHCFQEKDNILYLGTPFSHSFGEANQEKKILYIDKDGKFLYNSTSTIVPSYVMITVTPNDLISRKIKPLSLQEHDYLKIVVSGSKDACAMITKDYLQTLMDEKVLPRVNNLFLQYSFTETVTSYTIDENQSKSKMFKDYVENYLADLPIKDLVLDFGERLYLAKVV